MSDKATITLLVSVLAIGAIASFAAFKAASAIFAIHMILILLACAVFLGFVARRAARFDPPQG